MTNLFFDHPILNSPYSAPSSHWELDEIGQPTQEIIEKRRSAKFVTPIPKPKNRKSSKKQSEIVFDEGRGLSTEGQQYDPTSIINEVRQAVDNWRNLPNQNQWQVTPETARLLHHCRHHDFSGIPTILLPGRGSRDSNLAHRSSAENDQWKTFPGSARVRK